MSGSRYAMALCGVRVELDPVVGSWRRIAVIARDVSVSHACASKAGERSMTKSTKLRPSDRQRQQHSPRPTHQLRPLHGGGDYYGMVWIGQFLSLVSGNARRATRESPTQSSHACRCPCILSHPHTQTHTHTHTHPHTYTHPHTHKHLHLHLVI